MPGLNAGRKIYQEARGEYLVMEKYGTVPPKFTKEWWSYFWMYYKWQTIGISFAVLAIIVTLVQCATNIKYDTNIVFAQPVGYETERMEGISAELAQSVDDITGDNEKHIFTSSMQLNSLEDAMKGDQYAYAMVSKLNLEIQTGESYVFIMTKKLFEEFSANGIVADCFEPAENFVPEGFDGSKILSTEQAQGYAVSLEGNRFLEERGIQTQDLCLMVKTLYQVNQDDEKHQALYENAKKAAAYLLSQS